MTTDPQDQSLIQRLRDMDPEGYYPDLSALLEQAAAELGHWRSAAADHGHTDAHSWSLATDEHAARIAELTKLAEKYRLDCVYHSDCRPNRQQAEAAIADAKAMNDQWADEVAAHRQTCERIATLEQALREIVKSSPESYPDASPDTAALLALIAKHRRHVELSPGAGASECRYALAVLDDVEADVQALVAPQEPPRPFICYSGDASAPFWVAVNATDDMSLYTLACALQEMEQRVVALLPAPTRATNG